MKRVVIIASLVGTLGGWTILTENYVRDNWAHPAAPQASSVQTTPNNPRQNILHNMSGPTTGTSRPNARTRSSR